MPLSAAAQRYTGFLHQAAHPRLAEPELFPPDPAEPDELEWQSRWFSGDFGRDFVTARGQPVHIADFGWWNHGAGPDFRDCVVDLAGETRRGSIELDPSARDWEAHGHGHNESYNDTILHLFLTNPGTGLFFTRTADHREVPQVHLDLTQFTPGSGERSAPARPGRCVQSLASLPERRVLEIMEDAARFRMETKGRRWRRIADIHGMDQAIFQGIAEALGYSRNKLPMSVLAQRLPLKFLHRRPGDAEARRELAGVALGGLEPGERRRGTEAGDAHRCAQRRDAVDERGFGPRDDEVDRSITLGDEGRRQVVDEIDAVPVGAADPRDRLFAPAAADDEDAHHASTPSNETLARASPISIG